MKVDTRILDLNILGKSTYAVLLESHKDLTEAKQIALECKENELNNGNVMEAVIIDTQLTFININLDRIEVAMTFKEDDAFELTHLNEPVCKN